MRNLSRACVLSIALSAAGVAEAADLALRPAAPPAIAYSWTGFYVGGTLGWAWGNLNPRSSTVLNGPLIAPENVAAVNATGVQSLKPQNWAGGIGAGVNWQTGNLVIGLEADLQAIRLAGTAINSGRYPTSGDAYTFTTGINTNWLLTVRPRVGWALDNWLVYATGGLAVSDVNATFLWSEATPPPNVIAEATTFTTVKAGYVAGGGVETAIGPRWTVKAEYLYVRMNTASTPSAPWQSQDQVFTHSTDLRASIARAGANFRF